NKMGKKRSSEDVDESKTHAKKGKVSETAEFNGTVFKAMLKEPTKAMKGLDTFITTAKKLPCPDLYDVVEGYIKISMECSEIFKLLEGDKQMESEMMLIFQSLEMILLRTASDLSHFSMVGFTIVKKAVSSYMKLIQTSLHSENHRFVRHCLSFLSAMVSQGADTAREVFSHFHFTKGLSALAKRKDKMGRPDVRMAYTQFALSFLVSGDNVTIGQLLEMKDFLPDILSSGLKEDRISTVNLILSTLQTKVVQRQAISKTQKVRFFTPSLLAQIASLYRWNGIVDSCFEFLQMAENAEEAGKMVVRKLVHNFLLNLCCSRKHGISFYDPSFGTAGRAGNIVLLQFVVGLKQATEDDLVSDLMVNILRVSPDILPRFFKETQYSFIPRLKSAWTDNITLLKKIYESQPEVSKAFQTREVVPLPRLLSMVLVTSLPPVCNKAFFTQGINHTTLSLMSFLLKRAQRNIELCLDRSVWLASDLYTPATMQDFTQQYREALGKVLPDMTSIVSKWQSLTKKEKGGNEGKKEGDVKEDSPEVIVLKALILQVMCLYQKVVPHLVSQSKFDFSKLLKGIVSEKGMREEVHPVLQHQILQLALDLPASKFSWFRVQDHVETGSGEKSVFFLLLKMFVSSNNSHLKMSTRKLVVKVLKDSGVFEYTWSELELWLEHLDRLQTDQQDTVIHFLERVLMCLVCNPYTYTDKVASLVQEAAYLQANLSGQDGDTASIPISHIDDVLDMVDVIMEGSEGETEELGPALSDDLILQTFPFSAVVPAVLEARNKLPATYRTEKGVIYDYMATVLCDVLHCQRDPLPLSLALLQYDKELNSSEDPGPPHHSIIHLHHYYTTWLPQQAREPLFQSRERPFRVSPSPVTFTGLLKTAYTQGASALLEDSFRRRLEKSLVTMEMAEYPVAAKQILLYIKTTVDNCSMVVLSVLSSILKHPCIEQWFLSLELSSVPPTSLNPVRLKLLCAQLSDCILGLLQSSASVLRPLNSLHLLSPYLEAVSRALLRELGETGERRETDKESRPVRAFMALHAYMEPSLLQELVSSLLLLPKEALITPGEGEKSPRAAELSVYGRTALQVLTETTSSSDASSSGSPILLLSQAHLQGLATLLLSCSSPSLETFLLQALRTQPGNAKLLHTDILVHCLQGPLTAATQALGVALLQNCSAHRLCFEVWCLQPQHLENLADQTETFLPLVNSYLQTAVREDPARPKEGRWLWSRLLCQTHCYCIYEVSLFRLNTHLLRFTGDHVSTTCISFLSVPPFRWQLVDPISAVLSVCPEELELWRTSVLSAALRWLSSSYGHNRDQNTVSLRCIFLLTYSCLVFMENLFLPRCRYRDPNFLSTLNRMLDLMYGGSEGPKDLVPLPTIHMMASSHSLFLPIMLGDEEDLSGNTQVKEALVSLLLSLVKRSPAVCSSSHFVVLLGGYGATLSTTDQNLLLLLQEYERNGFSLVDFQCMLWGPAAVEHHKARRSLGVSLWQQPSSEDLLALLSPDTMINTITHFPLQRRIILQEGKELIFKDEEVKDLGSVYDPCFLLPLFSAMLQPESVIDCLKFVSSHGLGVTMVSLSSYDPKLRAAAYQVLASYHHHLEAARFREKRQLLYLLDMVKNGIRQQNLRMPFVLTTYITKVARQMLKPEEHMYVVVNRFLLSHQCLDFRRVPEFFKLFYSCDMEHKMEREWILSVLEEGLKDRQCYDLLDQQGIFQTLLGFCCSPLCDQHTQTLIVRVLHQAGRVTKAAYNLTKGHGLLTWILQLLERRHVDQGLLSAVVELLHVLWFTNLGQKETRGEGVLPLPLISQFLFVVKMAGKIFCLVKHLSGWLVKAGQLSLYLQTLSSILQHCGTALGVHGEAGWLTLRPQALSSQDALALLHRWSTLTHNAPLLSQLQTVAEKHKVKELLGERLLDMSWRSSSVQAQARSHSRPKEQEEEGEVERREEEKTLLEKCIPHLRNIFTHWEPVSLACPPSYPTSPPPSPDPHTPTSTPLANTTAHLLTRWFLNSLVEGASTYEDKRTVHFLRWFQKTVLSHRFIVDLVLADPAVRVDLLRLYHQACEPQAQTQISSRVEHVQLFTNIMIQLLESRGCTESDLHRAVLTACLMLLSLYIHEMWSGAKSPELFLNHVRLANEIQGSIGTKDQKKKSKRRSQTHTALRTICSDLLSGLQSTVAP
uniref:URB1 ribosome biogenesis homolog n=1 Tax=Oncorhynchus tshawytscha TaxID=74940 RepID=A0A8C8CC37_ONCTS